MVSYTISGPQVKLVEDSVNRIRKALGNRPQSKTEVSEIHSMCNMIMSQLLVVKGEHE